MTGIATIYRTLIPLYCVLCLILFMSACGKGNSSLDTSSDEDSIMNDSQWTVDSFDYGVNPVVILSGFIGPYGLTPTAKGDLYVADLKEGRVIRFNSSLQPTGWLGAQSVTPVTYRDGI